MELAVIKTAPNRRCRQAGLTLVELVISLALTALLVTALSFMYITAVSLIRTYDYRQEVQQTARIAAEAIGKDLQFAKEIKLISGSSIVILTGKLDGGDDDSQPEIIRYYVAGNILRRQVNQEWNQPLTGNSAIPVAVQVQFSGNKPNPDTVFITCTATATDNSVFPAIHFQYTLQTAVTRLN
jgi:Tfp pilus assembly protein PilW